MPLPPIDVVTAPRTLLRPVKAADLPALLAVNGDPAVTSFLPYATWRDGVDAHDWLMRMDALVAGGTARQLVIVHRAEDRAIGTALLFRHEEGSRRAELGYVLGRAYWGQGLAREAIGALVGHAFSHLGLRRIEAEVDPDNTASAGLLLRLGFVREGRLRQRWEAKGRIYDVELFGALAHEWAPAPPAQ